jgi:carnitine-CoA ligase
MEVEAEINAHPQVIESAVVGVPSELGEQEVMAAIVVGPTSTLEPKDLIEFLRPRMPRYAIPRYIEFVETLPKTSTQKIQKALIRARGVTDSTWDRMAQPSRQTADRR